MKRVCIGKPPQWVHRDINGFGAAVLPGFLLDRAARRFAIILPLWLPKAMPRKWQDRAVPKQPSRWPLPLQFLLVDVPLEFSAAGNPN
jgi:hypothetical protein